MLYLPQGLPAITTLQSGSHEIREYNIKNIEEIPQDTLRILFLNLMPQKAVTELDISRMLLGYCKSVALLPMKISNQTYKTTPISHMETFYNDFEFYEGKKKSHYDGLIITGAPVEHLPFEEVRYWNQLCSIMDWAKTHVHSTLYICWGAQAGLYHLYNVPKHKLNAKKFGIFQQKVLFKNTYILKGLSDFFPMPNSRHTEVRRTEIEPHDLKIIAESEESGVGIVTSADEKSEIFIVGHLEYEPNTLHNEYMRDLGKGLPISAPLHYYLHDKSEEGVDFSWEKTAKTFYHNWLSLCENK